MSVTYTQFFSEVVPYVNDVPDLVAENAVRNACIEFCEKSLYWQDTVRSQDLVSGTSDYTFTLPADTAVAHVVDAWADSRRLIPASEEMLSNIFMFDWHEREGAPQYYTQITQTGFTVVPTPNYDVTSGLSVIVALKPTRSSTSTDSVLLDRWAEVIGYGARSRLHAMPNQAFTEPTLAATYRAMFLAGINQARVERNRGLVRTSLRVRNPRFV